MNCFAHTRTHFRLGILLLMLLSLAVSCQKKDEEQTKKNAQLNERLYSSESVYLKVKQKIAEHPNDARAWYHLADLYDRNGQYAKAVESYKKVVELDPSRGYTYFKMGSALSRLNQPAEAVKAFKKAVELIPKNPVLFNNMGVAYGKMNQLDEEAKALKHAIELRPNYAAAHLNLGITYLKQGNRKAAQKEYETLMNIHTGAAEVLLKKMKKSS
ncbi:MAG: tetratricopeptide repeat protein [Deltaproteobacteria bacterium]|jgi:tetratricopeptide (TPR) repeat protein